MQEIALAAGRARVPLSPWIGGNAGAYPDFKSSVTETSTSHSSSCKDAGGGARYTLLSSQIAREANGPSSALTRSAVSAVSRL